MEKKDDMNRKGVGVRKAINNKLKHLTYRIGRKLYAFSRADISASPEVNGEYFLLEKMVESISQKKVILVDVGAHMGEWSAFALSIIRLKSIPFELHLFEPTSSASKKLSERFSDDNIYLNQFVVSNTDQMMEIYIDGDDYGTNSLYCNQRTNNGVELIAAVTLDTYFLLDQKIDFLKIDTEGHDYLVIDGARRLFESRRVGICQFEYNHRWAFSRTFLKDIFDWVKDKDYLVCKMHSTFIAIYSEWHPEMERFFEANYLLVENNHPLLVQLGRHIKYDEWNVPREI